MKFKKYSWNKLLFIGGAVIYLSFLFFFKQYKDVWWDSCSYIGMGKYIFSFGHEGVFEPMKSVLLPFFIGLFWKIGFDAVFVGKLIIFLAALASLIFTYLISKDFFDEKVAIISTAILFSNSLFFIFMFRIYTEMLSIALILGSFYFAIKFYKTERNFFLFFVALLSSLAFLTKYQNLIFFGLVNLFFLFFIKEKKVRSLVYLNFLFLLFVSPFLIANQILYDNPTHLVTLSSKYFEENLGSLYNLRAYPGIPPTLFKTTDWIYPKTIFYLFNFLLPFLILGIYRTIKERDPKKIFFILLPFLVFFIFLQIFYLKQDRYLMLTFPFLSVLAAIGLSRTKKKTLIIALSLYLVVSFGISIVALGISSGEESYTSFFSKPLNISCETAATSDPRTVLNPSVKRTIFPYEVFDDNWNLDRKGVEIISQDVECVFYFSCSDFREEHMKELESAGYKLNSLRDTNKCLYALLKR